MSIVLITGVKGAGKDTAGMFFINRGYKRYAFADELKNDAAKLYGLPIELFHARETKDTVLPLWNVSPRDICIKLGSYARQQDPNHWANCVKEQIIADNRQSIRIVITDCRYQNEIDVIKTITSNVSVIRILRAGVTSSDECDLQSIHCDYTLCNNDTIDNLHQQLSLLFT